MVPPPVKYEELSREALRTFYKPSEQIRLNLFGLCVVCVVEGYASLWGGTNRFRRHRLLPCLSVMPGRAIRRDRRCKVRTYICMCELLYVQRL